ncbi:MAG: glycosyltransferase family 2 protein [Jatrophihabitantaceae bacterium]
MLDVILPCLDEAQALPWVLNRLPAGSRAIVVDNGSQDGSAQLAAELGAQVLHCSRRGYGAACHAGLLAATAELVAFCDCDASIDPAVLMDFSEPLLSGAADLVIGRRRPRSRAAWPAHARLANSLLAARIRRLTGVAVHDIGPLRVARRLDLLALDQRDRRSGYPLETVLFAARAGWRIVERDVNYLPRAGRSKVTGTVRGTMRAIHDMSVVLAR